MSTLTIRPTARRRVRPVRLPVAVRRTDADPCPNCDGFPAVVTRSGTVTCTTCKGTGVR